MTGIEMTHVPYKGLAPAFNDVVAGHVSLMFGDFGTALPLVKVRQAARARCDDGAAGRRGGRDSAASRGGPARLCRFVVADGGRARHGIPRPILDKLNGELRAILAEPGIQHDFSERGLVPVVSPPPDELRDFVKSEIVRWRKVVVQAGAAGSQ